jgi:large subunit ribosomal protein L15
VAESLNLSDLKPAQARRDRKRVGRGPGSGKGRYSGRGIKGQKARAGSNKMRPGFEGGQNPVYMRMGKQRGATSKDAMPIGPFMTYSQPINLAALEQRFEAGAEITPEALKEAGLIKKLSVDVKILGNGELTKKLTVTAHRFSKTAVEKIEAAGGSLTWLKPPQEKKKKRAKKAKPAESAAPAAQDEAVDVEAAAERPVREADQGRGSRGNRKVPPAESEAPAGEGEG